MQSKKATVRAAGLIFVYLLIGGLLIIRIPTDGYSSYEQQLYIALIVSYYIVIGLTVYAILRKELYIFEPFSIITVLYVGIFILRPFQDLLAHSVSYAGKNLVDSGVKSTILFTIGYICFFIGYYFPKEKKSEVRILKTDYQEFSNIYVVMWAVFFVFCIICQFSQGMTFRYIFSLGTSGDREMSGNNSLLLFLSNFATSLLVVWMIIMVKSRNTPIKIVITALTAVYLLMRNSRWLVLIMILAPITYYYTKRKKSPRMTYLLLAGFLALVLFSWMQLNRYNIAMGRAVQGFGEQGLTLSVLMSPFDSDLTTYTTFYGMVKNFPSQYPYFYGKTFLYLFVLFVPRILWPAKPDNPVRDMIEHSLGTIARINGRAVSNIGEYYSNFGIIGIILLMFLFGYVVSKLKSLYEEPSENRLIIYSVLFPLMFQWTARGNFGSNFYYTLFSFVPFFIYFLVNKSIRSRS